MRAQHAARGMMASPGRVAAAGKDGFPETLLSSYVSSLAVPGIFGALTWRADKSPFIVLGREIQRPLPPPPETGNSIGAGHLRPSRP